MTRHTFIGEFAVSLNPGTIITQGLGRQHPSEYRAWADMKQRCFNKKHKSYDKYGGRGIIVCDRWKNSFAEFLRDMGPKPSPRLSIDRIENNGNYEPGNCRWANTPTQLRNRRNNVFLEWNGERLCVKDWSSRTGLSTNTIQKRIDLGWQPEAILTTPADSRMKKNQGGAAVLFDGAMRSYAEISRQTGVPAKRISARIRMGWTVEDAIAFKKNGRYVRKNPVGKDIEETP